MAKATKGGVVAARTRDGIVDELFCLQDEAYEAREQVVNFVGASPNEIYFTRSENESDN